MPLTPPMQAPGLVPPVRRAEGVTFVDMGVRRVVAVPGGDGGGGGSARAVAGVGGPARGEDEAEPHHWQEAAAGRRSAGGAGCGNMWGTAAAVPILTQAL